MTVVSSTILKSYFETGDTPTQAQFASLVETACNNAAPSVFATHTSGSLVTSGSSTLILKCNTEYTDTGSNYNTSTGYFTAPYAGKYFISTSFAGMGSVLNDYFSVGVSDDSSACNATFIIPSTSLNISSPTVTAVFDVVQGAQIYSYIQRLSGTGTFTLSTMLVNSSTTIYYLGE